MENVLGQPSLIPTITSLLLLNVREQLLLEGSVRRKGNVHIKAVTDMEVGLRGVQPCADCHAD